MEKSCIPGGNFLHNWKYNILCSKIYLQDNFFFDISLL